MQHLFIIKYSCLLTNAPVFFLSSYCMTLFLELDSRNKLIATIVLRHSNRTTNIHVLPIRKYTHIVTPSNCISEVRQVYMVKHNL
jgi:hypothetical protein